MNKITKLFALTAATVMLMSSTVLAAPTNSNTINNANLNNNVNNNVLNVTVNTVLPPIEKTTLQGRVSWEDGIIEAVGTGLPPANARNAGQASTMARRAAIVDAQRNLIEAIKGVQVDAETTMVNLMIENDTVKTKVSGLLQGAKIIRQQSMPDGSYQVIMAVNIHGGGGLAETALPAIGKNEPIQPFATPSPSYTAPVTNALYTGVIIDARGFGLQGAFSPAIYDATGTIVYGNKNIDINYAIREGMVEYTITPEMVQSAEMGQSPRVGSRPLIIKALSIRDNCNVVISVADANAMLSYNQSGRFLEKCAVIFER